MTKVQSGLLLAALSLVGAGVVAMAQPAAPPAPVPEIRPGVLAGYLAKGAEPDSLAIVPPAPARTSATQARDNAEVKWARGLRGGPRWSLATRDADLTFPAAAGAFACALDVEVSPETTPRLYMLLRRTLTDASLSTVPTKTKYQRPRPFMVTGGPTCTPGDEAAPDRADAVLARGRTFLQSRVVCNVHWLNDTEAGATMGASVVARLHDEPEFRADLDAARAEIARARAAGEHPARDCRAEAAALASAPIVQP